MNLKQYLKKFWEDNKKGYMWSCIILTLATVFIYDLMFLSMTNQAPITLKEYTIWMPVMYACVGIMALGTGTFVDGGKK